jgi:ATP-binding cassette subfamily F protein 3
MILAGFSNLCKAYPSGKVLTGASGAVKSGDMIALLGSNGTGKTTLFEILAGNIESDSGSLEIPKAVKRKYLSQTIDAIDKGRLVDYAMGGLDNLIDMRHSLQALHEKLENDHNDAIALSELGKLQEKFEASGGYDIETRTKSILRGIGFDESEFEKELIHLSGGQRNRAALARTLVSEPDLLLLDEPTNHLDISGMIYLEEFLKSYQGGVVYVSHDRMFVRNTATVVWEMVAGKVVSYNGRYDFYLAERERRMETMIKSYEAQREFISKTEDYIRRNIAGQKTKQAQSRRRMLKKLERLDKPSSGEHTAAIGFSNVERSTRIVVKSEETSFAYDNNIILKDLNFEVERGEKIGLFGPNGAGKTTLLKLITAKLKPITGKLEIGKKLSIGYYDQLSEDLNLNMTPLQTIKEMMPLWNEGQARSYLGKFLFSNDDVFREVRTFSGGEQSRLALAKLIVTEPNFLVLDEPTNHLDIQSREALENALVEYKGTVLCVSHDRYFLDQLAERIFSIEDNSIRIYLGGYSDYDRKKKEETASLEVSTTKKSSQTKPRKIKTKRTNPLIIKKIKDDVSEIEEQINTIEIKIAELESSSDWQKLSDMLDSRDDLYKKMEKLIAQIDDLNSINNSHD